MRSGFAVGVIAVSAGISFSVAITPLPAAHAQPPASAPAEPTTDLSAAFAAMMQNPADPEAAFRYARLAAAAGQPQAAIAALERVLRINPRLDNIRLELASLYLATGAPEAAGVLLRQALVSPDIPPEVADRARGMLARADQGTSRTRLFGSVFAGARYDTNANEQPLGGRVVFSPDRTQVFPIQLDPSFSGRSSWSSVLSGNLTHQWDLGLQREGTLETSLSLYDQRYARVPRDYDISIASLETGPRLGIADLGETGSLTIRPFVSAVAITYADSLYATLLGGGATLQARFGDRWTVGLTGLVQGGNYLNSGFRPRARDNTGVVSTGIASLSYNFDPTTALTLRAGLSRAETRQAYLDNDGWFIGASFGTTFRLGDYAFGAGLRAGYRRRNYDSPDPTIDPNRARRDRRYEAGVTLILPITPTLAATAEFDWYDQRSNIINYRYDNKATILGLRYSF